MGKKAHKVKTVSKAATKEIKELSSDLKENPFQDIYSNMGRKSYQVGTVSSLLASEGKEAAGDFDEKLLNVFSSNEFKSKPNSAALATKTLEKKKKLKKPQQTLQADSVSAESPPKILKNKKNKKQLATSKGGDGNNDVNEDSARNGLISDIGKSKKKSKKIKLSGSEEENKSEVIGKKSKLKGKVNSKSGAVEETPENKSTKRTSDRIQNKVKSKEERLAPSVLEKKKRKSAEGVAIVKRKTKKQGKITVAKTYEENEAIIEAFEKEQGEQEEDEGDSDVDEHTKLRGDTKDEPKKKVLKNFELNTPKEKKIEEESRTVFVGNLPPDMQKKALMKMFKTCGKVETVRFRCATPMKPYLLKKVAVNSKKFNPNQTSIAAYVRFSSMEEAQKAIAEMNGTEVNKHHIVVDTALPVKKDPKKSIFVGNLPLKAADDDLWKYFIECGSISSVRIIRDSNTGLSRGFGYVNFQERDSVQLALKKNGTDFNGREIRVMKTVKKLKKPKDAEKPGAAPKPKPNFSKGFSENKPKPMNPAERRIRQKQKYSFSGEAAESKKVLIQKKPDKTAIKKAKIASILTGASTTEVKKTLGMQKKNFRPLETFRAKSA